MNGLIFLNNRPAWLINGSYFLLNGINCLTNASKFLNKAFIVHFIYSLDFFEAFPRLINGLRSLFSDKKRSLYGRTM